MASIMEPETFANSDQKRAVVDFGQSHPDLPAEEIIKKGKQQTLKNVNVKLQNKDMNRLDKYSEEQTISSSEAAGEFVLDGLSEAGY